MSSDYLKKTLLADEVARAEAVGAVEAALVESVAGSVDEVRDKQVLIRVSESQRDQWQECAEADGLLVSEWLRQMADARWREVFTCMHPLEKRKSYPWSEFCLDCGSRLR